MLSLLLVTTTTTILYLCPHGVTLCTTYFIVIIISEIGEDHRYLRIANANIEFAICVVIVINDVIITVVSSSFSVSDFLLSYSPILKLTIRP